MRITRLELKGYRRLMLGSIDHITYTPESRLQIILGTNGCGKSSLLAQLSPLPASPQDFKKDGFKKIWIEHRGIEYYLESSFRSGSHHSFLKGGQELNPGHTGQIQREIVKQEFGWTPQIHDLITGLDRFTLMGPSKRREWIMQLSTANYQYATKVFNQIYSKNRDAQGAIKHLDARLATERNNLRSVDVGDGLEQRVEQLRNELNTLLISIDSTLPKVQEIEPQITALLGQISALATRVLQTKLPPTTTQIRGYQALVEACQREEQVLQHQQQLLDQATADYAELEHQAAQLGQTDVEVPENLEQLIAQAQAQLQTLSGQLRTFRDIHAAHDAYQASLRIQQQWHEIFSTLPDNEDRRYSPPELARVQQAMDVQRRRIDESTGRLTVINHRRQVLQSIQPTECPSCRHIWKEGFSATEIAQLDQWETEHNAVIENAQQELTRHQAYVTTYEEVSGLYRQLKGLMNGYPVLAPLWHHVTEHNLHLIHPNRSVGLIRDWINDCQVQSQIDETHKHIDQLQLIAQRQADGTLNHLAYRRKQLTDQIEQYTAQITQQRQRVRELQGQRQQVDGFLKHYRSLESLVQQVQDLVTKNYSAHANALIEAQVSRHQHEMATIQNNLTQFQTLRGIVEDLEQSRAQVHIQQKALAVLTTELSPISGLIAEDIAGFIGCIVEQINAVIASIWTYDLEVLPCEMETGGDLNYRFPLSNGITTPTSDVSKGSAAQQDVVNFAFVLMVLMYLDLGEVPLFLDELGASFDEQHRINVMSFVKQLVDSHRYSQVFLISHYASNYAAMSGAQIMVLDSTNVAIPQHHNEHVVFA